MFDPTKLTATINGVDHKLNLDPVERSTGDGITQTYEGVLQLGEHWIWG